jgi:anaerobic glycerol-3-phosphate dehydrogenase
MTTLVTSPSTSLREIDERLATNYDLAIIGSGFSGLAAICKAVEQKLTFCHVTKGRGMSQHFSGAFDVIDPRWCDPFLKPADYPSLANALNAFILGHPNHPYARIAKNYADFSAVFLEEMARFFSFYNIPVVGNFKDMVVAFGSTGMAKPTGCALKSQGLLASQLRHPGKVLYLNFPGLVDYPTPTILNNLKQYFPDVSCVTYGSKELFEGFDQSSYLAYFNLRDHTRVLKEFIRQNKGDASHVFLPPILGLDFYDEMHNEITRDLDIDLVELLSVLPSASGLRFSQIMETFASQKMFPSYSGTMLPVSPEEHMIKNITVTMPDGTKKEIVAQVFILATGTANSKITHIIPNSPLLKQDFMRQGFSVSYERGHKGEGHGIIKDYNNLRACGTAIDGFDFTRDRCGFGVGLASAFACFE